MRDFRLWRIFLSFALDEQAPHGFTWNANPLLLKQLCSSQSTGINVKRTESHQRLSVLFLVEAAGLEPTVSSTRNWRDTTFATPRNIKLSILTDLNDVALDITIQFCNVNIISQVIVFVNSIFTK